MKNTLLGLVAATLVATPALAISWKTELFTRLDANHNGELAIEELQQTGCTVDQKLFKIADSDKSQGLSNAEFFSNRTFFSRCK